MSAPVVTEGSARFLSRRVQLRYRCEKSPTRRVFLVESYRSCAAELIDLSRGGAGLRLERPLRPGALVFIDLMGLDVPVEFLARVVHSTPRQPGEYVVGCEFDRPLTRDELNMALKFCA